MSDAQAIAATIQVYFDSMYLSDPDKVHQAFHPNAKVTGYMGRNLLEPVSYTHLTLPTKA